MESNINAEIKTDTDKSYWRQHDIFRADENTKIVIIGAGGIGSWCALGFSKIGFSKIEVWDGDIVESHNIPNQLFGRSGVNKAEELARTIDNVTAVPKMWNGEALSANIIILAVDNMEVRKHIVETQRASLIIDGRIGGEFMMVLSVSPIDFESKKFYLETWYPSGDAVELPCTARSIADVGFFVAGLIINLTRKFLKENKITRQILFDAKLLEIIKITTEGEKSE
jgi:molybdopterin/thiamine biosynthesis adenylyltransferase